MAVVYKIVAEPEWTAAVEAGQYAGSVVDLRDGFIHLSTAAQVAETWEKHFRGQPDLLLVGFEVDRLGPELRWEVSRNGESFPHLYSPLPTHLALKVERIDPATGPVVW